MIKKLLKNEFFLLSIIISLAIFLRLFQLTEIPPGLTGDEAWTGLDALEILKNGYIGPYVPVHAWGQMAGYLYYQAFIFKIFQVSFFTLRLSAAIIGILTIFVFYFLSKSFFNKKTSLLITFLFSISHWHLHFSHMAFFLIAVPLFSISSFYFLIKGFKDKKIIFFILGGIFLGLGLNTYFSFAFSVLAILFFIVYKVCQLFKKQKIDKRVSLGLLAFILSAFIIFLPLGNYILKNHGTFFGRNILTSPFIGNNRQELEMKYGQISNSKIVFLNARNTLLMFHYQGDKSAIDNLPNQPMLDKITGILMLIGLFLVIKNIRKEKQFLIFFWFLMALTAGFLTAGAPNGRRTIDALPAIFLFTGFGIEAIKSFIKKLKLKRKFKKITFIILFLFLIIFTFWENFNIFFIKYPKESSAKFWFAYNQVKMCEYLNSKYPNHYVYFFSDFWSWDYKTRRFLCPNIEGQDALKTFTNFNSSQKTELKLTKKDGKIIYIILPPYKEYSTNFKNLYNGYWEEVKDEDGKLIFSSFLKHL